MVETQDRGGALAELADEVEQLRQLLERAIYGNLDGGNIAPVRARLEDFAKSHGHYPGFLDVGVNVFYDVYDWHVRQRQPIRILRLAEARFGIQFMFTQLVLWPEVPNANYLGVPRD